MNVAKMWVKVSTVRFGLIDFYSVGIKKVKICELLGIKHHIGDYQ